MIGDGALVDGGGLQVEGRVGVDLDGAAAVGDGEIDEIQSAAVDLKRARIRCRAAEIDIADIKRGPGLNQNGSGVSKGLVVRRSLDREGPALDIERHASNDRQAVDQDIGSSAGDSNSIGDAGGAIDVDVLGR